MSIKDVCWGNGQVGVFNQ